MTTVEELKQQAEALRKEKRFVEALPLYQDLWENHREACDVWDGWKYAQCLSKEKKYTQALDVHRAVYRLAPDFQINNNAYGWAIYHSEIAVGQVQDERRYLKAAEAILRLCRQDDAYSPYVRTVLAVAKHFQNPFNARAMAQWLTKVDAQKLRDDIYSITGPDGKSREQASDRERYYAGLSKALLEIEDYPRCIQVCEEALSEIKTLHYDNDIWFRWRIALSKYYLNDVYEAIAIAEELLQKRREWFMLYRIAEMIADVGDFDRALKYAAEAALGFGDLDKKLKLFQMMADLLSQMGRADEAKEHLSLVYRIRKERGWRVSNDLYRQMQAFSIAEKEIPTSKNLARRLRPKWMVMKHQGEKQFTGKISKVLPNGKAGFIQASDGGSYYFQVKSFKGRRELLQEGTAVAFYLEDGFDVKKGRATKNAVDISIFA